MVARVSYPASPLNIKCVYKPDIPFSAGQVWLYFGTKSLMALFLQASALFESNFSLSLSHVRNVPKTSERSQRKRFNETFLRYSLNP